ncbi:MAG: YrdB family protein [Haloferacaceae archaeon]
MSVDAPRPVEVAVAGVRFVLEVCALLALGYWGFRTGDGVTRYALALGAPLVAAAVWGLFGSPAAPRRLPGPARLLLEAVVFAAAAVALFLAGMPVLAGAFALVAVVDRALLFALGDPFV